MGLDITAYSKLQLVDPALVEKTNSDDRWDQGWILGFAYEPFVKSTRGLQGHDQPCPQVRGCIGTGWYTTTFDTQSHGFRAGSYSGYGMWRSDLEAFAELQETDSPREPFEELTYFADNEGCIGPEAAKDLLADFRKYEKAYKASHDDYYNEKYDDWTRACELAADGGLIEFH